MNKKLMSNATLRERFGIVANNSAVVSRVIKQAVNDGRIKSYDDTVGNKAMRYIPWWA